MVWCPTKVLGFPLEADEVSRKRYIGLIGLICSIGSV